MNPLARTLTVVGMLALIALSLGCQGTTARFYGAAGAGGSGAGGMGGSEVDAAPPSDGSTKDAAPSTCNATPTPLRTSGGTLALAIEPRLGGKAFVFGEPNATPDGGTITPLNFRFYVSHVALARATGAPVPVDLVTASGAPEPYGIHLFNAEDPTSHTLRVLAPPGAYTGITFTLGIDDGCNSEPPSRHTEPLTDSSQMTWPHLIGYLFLRYEGQVAPAATADAGAPADAGAASDAGAAGLFPSAVHMGGVPGQRFAPTVTTPGAFSIAAGQPTQRPLILDVGTVFQGAATAVDPASLEGLIGGLPETILAGERLRQHAPGLPLFVLGP